MRRAAVLVAGSLAVLSALACFVVERNGWTLYYGDAEAHLEIARRIVDSKTPGWGQIGAVWLPLPHLLMLPLVWNDFMWRTGLAGTIPSALFFILGGTFLFLAARLVFESTPAALVATGIFAFNPNILYLQATPMTESIFYGSLMALFYFTVLFERTHARWSIKAAAVATIAATLTRYEGWFLIPFVALYFFWRAPEGRLRAALLYGVIAGLGPLAWVAHNAWWFGDPLDFYHGPYSAMAIQKGLPYPGHHEWLTTWHYLLAAGRWTAGWATVILGVAGFFVAIAKRAIWPLVLFGLSPLFYAWSLYSSGPPIFVPNLPPHGWYNSRYGLCFLPLFAIGGGALVLLAKDSLRAAAASALLLLTAGFWLVRPTADRVITWQESDRNSISRRAWTNAGARYLAGHYRGGGILSTLGDVAGIYREAGIPLRETLNDSNEPQWILETAQPDYFLNQRWAVAQAGDLVSVALGKSGRHGASYKMVADFKVEGAPNLQIYRRENDETSIH